MRSHRRKLYRSPKTAAELISRYQKGERSFPGTTLSDECIESSLPGIDLRDSTLRIVFSDVNLTQACFRGADLAFTHFDGKFAGANFERAELVWVDFGSSELTGSSFRNTDLRHTHFESCVLDDCDFTGAQLDHTNFLDVSLFSLCKSSSLIHEAPSYVDHRTVIRSIRSPHLKDSLLRMGMPAIFVESMVDCARSLSETSMFPCSVFSNRRLLAMVNLTDRLPNGSMKRCTQMVCALSFSRSTEYQGKSYTD